MGGRSVLRETLVGAGADAGARSPPQGSRADSRARAFGARARRRARGIRRSADANSSITISTAPRAAPTSVLFGLGFTEGDLAARRRGIFRRNPDAYRAGEAAARRARVHDARRADQPSRYRGAQLARGLPRAHIRAGSFWSRTIATFSIASPSARSKFRAGGSTEYVGGYSRYLVLREERFALEMAAYEKQREEIEHMESFISRFRYQASKARLVQSRIKQLEKLERLEPPEGSQKPPAISFPKCERSTRRVFELKGAVKKYGGAHGLRRRRSDDRARSANRAGRS